MTVQEVKQLKSGDTVGFAGILATTSRRGKFIRLINRFLAEIEYSDHKEHNHITNLFKV